MARVVHVQRARQGCKAPMPGELSLQHIFEEQVRAGVCIICGKPAKSGTRYCNGDRGCPTPHRGP